jgi:hypothetical protein
MEYILIHKPIGILPPEVMKLTMEMARKLGAKPQEFVPGGKLIASYYAIGGQAVYCIWDAPNIEALAPLLRNMSIAGWNTEVIPAERAEVALANIEKAMQAMQAQMMGQ